MSIITKGSAWRNRIGLTLLLSLLSATAVVVCHRRVSVTGPLNITKRERTYTYRFDPADHRVLQQLKKNEDLHGVVSAGQSEWAQLILLRNWVSAQGQKGDPTDFPQFNAIGVLEQLRRPGAQGFCAHYAELFLQSCLSLGWTARYMEIGNRQNPVSHFTVEVWVRELGQWVMLDPFYNHHFEKEGRPLSCLGIHRALLSGDTSVVAVKEDGSHLAPQDFEVRFKEFYYLRFLTVMDHLTRDLASFDRRFMVEWEDSQMVAWDKTGNDFVVDGDSFKGRWLAGYKLYADYLFDQPAELAYVTVTGQRLWGRVAIHLDHHMEGFSHYAFRVSGDEWQTTTLDEFVLDMPSGELIFEVVPVSQSGRFGAVNRISISY